MIDKKSLDFVFIAPKLKVNKMVSFWLQFLAGCTYATVLRLSVVCLRLSSVWNVLWLNGVS